MEKNWITLREVDEAEHAAKGTAFRAFRRIEAHWSEPQDFRVLHHDDDRAIIDSLRAKQRIYSSTVNLLLLSPALATAVRAQMRRMITDPAE
ncbi:MAG: hypothetical protein JWQ90_3167 [Hydrocarboniphaga sp.]|nr:hypothetical protein [Hydrocarboniphaga sp.]